MKKTTALNLLLMLSVFLTALVSSAWAQGGNRNLQASIKTDRSQYARNRAVEITMTLTNTSNQTVAVSTGGNLVYQFTVRDARTNHVVFTAPSRATAPRTGGFTLQAGQTLTYREFWERKDTNGRQVPSGVYQIEARLYPQNSVSTQIYLVGSGGGNPGTPPTEPGLPQPPPGGGSGGGSPQDPAASLLQGLTGALRVDKPRARVGDTVTLTYTVASTKETPRVLPFASGQRFDMLVTSGPKTLWQWSQDKRFTMSLGGVSFESREAKTFTATWRVPQEAPPGSCTIAAYLTVRGVPGGTACRATTSLQIVP